MTLVNGTAILMRLGRLRLRGRRAARRRISVPISAWPPGKVRGLCAGPVILRWRGGRLARRRIMSPAAPGGCPGREARLVDDELLGPVDYLAVEWPGAHVTGEGFRLLLDLVERGI